MLAWDKVFIALKLNMTDYTCSHKMLIEIILEEISTVIKKCKRCAIPSESFTN